MHAARLRTPPPVPHRGYPSLSDDGQPYFTRRRPRPRSQEARAPETGFATDRPRLSLVRAVALLGIAIIIFFLLAAA